MILDKISPNEMICKKSYLIVRKHQSDLRRRHLNTRDFKHKGYKATHFRSRFHQHWPLLKAFHKKYKAEILLPTTHWLKDKVKIKIKI
jgi:hypothetical protein